MNEWKSAAHVRYNLWYHLVWSPKYRKGILADKATKSLIYKVICEIAERYEFEVRRVAVDDDHVHVFLQAPPRYAPSEIVRIIKGITAREVFKVFPEKRKLLWGGGLWEDGYAVRSVGDKVSEEIIQRYLDHHYKEIGHELKQLELF
jgi:putative transposase